MKKVASTYSKENPSVRKPKSRMKWQTGNYDRHQTMEFYVPYPFLLLCRLLEVTPAGLLSDYMDNLACGSWNREGRDRAKTSLIEAFIEMGYGQHLYTVADIRTMFTEMDALGSLFPKGSDMKLVDTYAHWRDLHEDYWFKKWFRKPRRKL